jgi:hypothetical protein
VLAIVLAVLYFGMVELLLLDSQRELAEARRFRARIVAETLAENGAELAALQLVTREATPPFEIENEFGKFSGKMMKTGFGAERGFDIQGDAVTSGITESKSRVLLRGRIVGDNVRIQYAQHQ